MSMKSKMEGFVFRRVPLVYFVLICFQTTFSSATYASMNVEELNSISYHVDILNNPILSAQESTNELVMHMTSKYGQEYECVLPNVANLLHDKHNLNRLLHGDPSASSISDISQLLKPLETSPCLIKTKDWWTYEFCYGKHIKQYHLEDNKVVSPIIVLGLYESEYNWQNESKADESSRNRLQRYHSQYYINGSTCEVTGTQRRSEVRFLCEDGAGDYIAHVDEPESCRYVMRIHTTKVCHHPFLRPPPNNKPHKIVCNPVLTSDQYTIFLKREEEEKKAVEERRKEWLVKQEQQLMALKQLKEEEAMQKEAEEESEKEKEEKEIPEVSETVQQESNEIDNVQESVQKGDDNEDSRSDLNIRKGQWESLRNDFRTVIKRVNKAIGRVKNLKMVEDYIGNVNKFEEVVTQKIEMQMEAGTEEIDENGNDGDDALSTLSKTIQTLKLYSEVMDRLNVGAKKDEGEGKEDENEGKKDEKEEKEDEKEEKEEGALAAIERAIEEKLRTQFGLDPTGRKVEVKIITAGFFDDDEDFHSTGDDDSSQFQTVLIKLMNEDTSEHLQHQSMLEKNYRFVWNGDDDKGEKTEDNEGEEESNSVN